MLARDCLLAVLAAHQCLSTHAADLHTAASFSFASARLQTCPLHTTSASGSTALAACVCAPGASLSDGLCAPCAADSYKDSPGSAACTPCPANTRSLPGAAAVAECLCAEGYALVAGVCTACPRFNYKSHVGRAACRVCPLHSTTPHSFSAGTSISACKCGPGTFGPGSGICAPCLSGTYQNFWFSTGCSPCPSFSSSPPRSNNIANCICIIGYTSTGINTCGACPAGTYKGATGNQECTSCPSNSGTRSTAVNTVQTDCLCIARYSGPPGGPCGLCAADFFCGGIPAQGNATKCRDHSSSEPGSRFASDCVCLPGFWSAPSGLCQECPRNHFCPGDNLMYECPGNSTAPLRISTLDDCVCDNGFIPQ